MPRYVDLGVPGAPVIEATASFDEDQTTAFGASLIVPSVKVPSVERGRTGGPLGRRSKRSWPTLRPIDTTPLNRGRALW